jgi:hypothetical protein
LNDFFSKKDGFKDDILASQYTKENSYTPNNLPLQKTISDKIDKQIVHITSKRFLTFEQKLNDEDILSATKLILDEAEHFRGQLRDEFKPWSWERRIPLPPS